MIILIKLILAHLIGDFVLQPSTWVAEKEELKAKSPKLYLHVFIHGALILLLLWNWEMWLIALCIMLIHLIIDCIKLYFQKLSTKVRWFVADQLLHAVSILIIWSVFTETQLDLSRYFTDPLILALVTLILFLTIPTSIILTNLLHRWSDSIPSQPGQSLQDAGKYIGILERLFVFTFIVAGHWEAVGFLLTAKSVFRFGDLKKSKERKLTEYILIGTLLSFGIAMLAGMLFLSLY